MSAAPGLLQLQRQMSAHVLLGDATIQAQIAGDASADSARRLGVYHDAYRLRLIEVLGNDFPVLKAQLGTEAFDALAADYLAAHPSRRPSVRHFGGAFSEWLREQSAQPPQCSELAAFEWAQGEVFDAADADVVLLADIAALAPQAWPELRLQLQPAARWLSLHGNAPALVAAHAADKALPEAFHSAQATSWLLWRCGFDVHWRSLAADEAAALQSARRGACFAELCEALAPWHAEAELPMRAASLLKLWICDELVAGLITTEET